MVMENIQTSLLEKQWKDKLTQFLLFSRCIAAIYSNTMSEYCISDINIFQKFLQIMLTKHKEEKWNNSETTMKQKKKIIYSIVIWFFSKHDKIKACIHQTLLTQYWVKYLFKCLKTEIGVWDFWVNLDWGYT